MQSIYYERETHVGFIKILSQAVTLVALFTPTCFDPYGSSSGSTYGSKHVGVKSATKVTACDNILIIYRV